MKVTYTYTCGHERTNDIDGRYAGNRRDIAEARRNNGVVTCDVECYECRKAKVTQAIDALSETEAKDILHRLAANRGVQTLTLRAAGVLNEDYDEC